MKLAMAELKNLRSWGQCPYRLAEGVLLLKSLNVLFTDPMLKDRAIAWVSTEQK